MKIVKKSGQNVITRVPHATCGTCIAADLFSACGGRDARHRVNGLSA